MNLLYALEQSGLIHRLGWGLVHSLWLGMAIAAVLAWALWCMRGRSANARYLACCGAMVVLLAATVGAVVLVEPPARVAAKPVVAATPAAPGPRVDVLPEKGVAAPSLAPVNAGSPPVVAAPVVAGAAVPSSGPWSARVGRMVEPYLPWVVLSWAGGVLAMALWQLSGWMGALRIRRMARVPSEAGIVRTVARLTRAMRISRPVMVLDSMLVGVPTVIGWLRPVILLPVGLATGLSTEQLEAILLHELAHIKRMDYLVNLLQRLVEAMLFYHPAVWFISRRIRIERENCCDDVALAACGEPTVYAEALLAVAGSRAPRMAMAANGGKLLPRIRRILGLPSAGANPSAWVSGGLALLVMVGMVAVPLACSNSAMSWAAPAGTEPSTGKELSEIAAQQTDLLPVVNADYRLLPNNIYKNKDGDPGPASAETSRAWTMANEFVYRTALHQLCQLPATSAGPEGDGYEMSFSRVGGAGELKVFVTKGQKAVRWLGIGSTPVAKDGLQVAALLPQATFGADEGLKFTVQFKNVSDKPLALNEAEWFWNWTLQFETEQGPWRLHLLAQPQPPLMAPRLCRAGETVDVPVSLGEDAYGHDFTWEGRVAGQAFLPLKQLRPGKYGLTMSIPLKEGPAGQAAPFWTGTIKTEPVEFEITGKAAAATPADAQQRAAAIEQVAAALKKAMPAEWICEVRTGDVTPGQWTPAGCGAEIVLRPSRAEAARTRLMGLGPTVWLMEPGYAGKPVVHKPGETSQGVGAREVAQCLGGPVFMQGIGWKTWDADFAAALQAGEDAKPVGTQPATQPSKVAMERAEALKKDIKNFRLLLVYYGEKDKPSSYRSLVLNVPPLSSRAKYPDGQITEAQAQKIIDYLATEGFLDRAEPPGGPLNVFPTPPAPAYRLAVPGFAENLGWSLVMLHRLNGLRTVLEGDAAKSMDLLLEQLAGQREEWKKQAATGAGTQPATARRKLLEDNLASLDFDFIGAGKLSDHDSPARLLLTRRDISGERSKWPWNLDAQLTEKEAARLVAAMADAGWLDAAKPFNHAGNLGPETYPGYFVLFGVLVNHEWQSFTLDLGWGPAFFDKVRPFDQALSENTKARAAWDSLLTQQKTAVFKPLNLHRLNLSFVQSAPPSELPDLFETVPPNPSYELRAEVRVIEDGSDGTYYYVPSKDAFYLLYHSGGTGQFNYYGPIVSLATLEELRELVPPATAPATLPATTSEAATLRASLTIDDMLKKISGAQEPLMNMPADYSEVHHRLNSVTGEANWKAWRRTQPATLPRP